MSGDKEETRARALMTVPGNWLWNCHEPLHVSSLFSLKTDCRASERLILDPEMKAKRLTSCYDKDSFGRLGCSFEKCGQSIYNSKLLFLVHVKSEVDSNMCVLKFELLR